MLKIYLDTSLIIKRYVTEPGTEIADMLFDNAERGNLSLRFSLWNIGEILGVLDERLRRGWITEKDFIIIMKNLSSELLKLLHLRSLEIIPVHTPILAETWPLILSNHIYEADALQIATCIQTKSDILISGDKKLVQIGRKIGVESLHVTEDKEKIEEILK
ncbi:MAG: type II toxin-antitoxin system VapC family toxin [Candidatus Bathyarchaeia archaeon]